MDQLEDLVPEIDREFLSSKGLKFRAVRAGEEVHVIIDDFPFPDAYTPRTASLLIKLPAGYPSANLDMFWTNPVIRLVSGDMPQNCTDLQMINEVQWQQWSRHFATAWRQGVDNLQTFVATIRRELQKGK